jgi:hypothetical protein
MMEGIYSFCWVCGRMGSLEGIFVADAEEVKKIIGKRIYFGEVLGKHSEVEGVIEEEDITLKTTDQDFIAKFEEYNLSSGYNPLDYYYPDEEELDEN